MLENKFAFGAFVSTFKNKQIVHFYYQHFGILLILQYMPWLDISVIFIMTFDRFSLK